MSVTGFLGEGRFEIEVRRVAAPVDATVAGDKDGCRKWADAVAAKNLVGAAGGEMGEVCPTTFFDEGADGSEVVVCVDGDDGEFAAPVLGIGF